jgi:hypothetical protein
MTDTIIPLHEAREAAEATAKLYDVACIVAEATEKGALNHECRLMLAMAVVRAAMGPGWGIAWTGERAAA